MGLPASTRFIGPLAGARDLRLEDVPGTCNTAGPDNCPFVVNGGQANSDTLPAGDDCQCGDVNDDGVVDASDLQVAGESLVGRTPSDTFVESRCNVAGPRGPGDCGVEDLYVLERFANGQPVSVGSDCDGYLGL